MRNRFDKQLKNLNDRLTEMGMQCEEVIALASTALSENNMEMAEKVHGGDDEIDRLERDIESLCLKMLLQQQPVARDLRQISAALKMITDLERIGDQAADIAEIILFLNGRSTIQCQDIKEMAKVIIKMVDSSIEAYVKRDLELAKKVQQADDKVDDLFLKIKNNIIGMIAKNQADGEFAIDMLMIAKYFERIGDHAVNVAEWVEFSLTGVHKGFVEM